MKKQKMTLANIQGKMSRDEMKNVNGGVDEEPGSGQCGRTLCRPLSTQCPTSCPCTNGTLNWYSQTP